jgi:tetratricopeptide (TPR) repeat protein
LKIADCAIRDYQQCLSLNPEFIGAYYNRALILWNEAPERAIQDFSTVINLQPTYVPAMVERGKLYYNLGRHGPALRDFDRALLLQPDDQIIIQMRKKTLKVAQETFEIAIAHDPDDFRLYLEHADVMQQAKQYDLALADLDRAVALAPTESDTWNNRGGIRYLLGDFAGTYSDLTKCIELAPNVARTYGNRAMCLVQLGRTQDALSDLDCAIQLDTDTPDYYYFRGSLLRQRGHFAPALQDLNQAIEINPARGDFYWERGLTFQAAGDTMRANSDFANAQSLGRQNS